MKALRILQQSDSGAASPIMPASLPENAASDEAVIVVVKHLHYEGEWLFLLHYRNLVFLHGLWTAV